MAVEGRKEEKEGGFLMLTQEPKYVFAKIVS